MQVCRSYINIKQSATYLWLTMAIAMLSISIYSLGDFGLALYPAYLLIIANSGKYGAAYLAYTVMLSSLGLFIGITINDFWTDNVLTGLLFCMALLIFPFYYWRIVKDFHLKIGVLQKNLVEKSYAAMHDPLTSLANRTYLFEKIEAHVLIGRRTNEKFALLYIDLDGFKTINDTCGHGRGDIVLKQIAEILLQSARKSDVVARIGGDEFAVLLQNVADEQIIDTISKRILTSITKLSQDADTKYALSASIGISVYPHHGETTEALVNMADFTMYRVKNEGKNNYMLATETNADSLFPGCGEDVAA